MTQESEEQMKERFWERAIGIMEQDTHDPQEMPRVGLEVEFAVMKNGKPVKSDPLLEIDCVDAELGASQIELRTDPIILDQPRTLLEELRDKEDQLYAPRDCVRAIRIGAIPNLAIDAIEVTDKEKYRIVPAFHDERRGPHINTYIGGVNFDKAKCVSLFSSLQVNTQADNLDDAVDKLNRSLMISPFIVAVSGNARVVDGVDTGFNDIRMPAWEASHDIRTEEEIRQGKETRTGLPNRYFNSIRDYFERCANQPFILDIPQAALEVGIGLNWLDTRIKFIDEKPIVEFRSPSVQPSDEEDVGLTLFYLGALTYSQRTRDRLTDIATVKENRDSAMKHGLRGKLVTDGFVVDASVAVQMELEKAERGLRMLGYKEHEFKWYTDIMRNRCKQKKTPADVFVEKIRRKPIEEVLMEYRF